MLERIRGQKSFQRFQQRLENKRDIKLIAFNSLKVHYFQQKQIQLEGLEEIDEGEPFQLSYSGSEVALRDSDKG